MCVSTVYTVHVIARLVRWMKLASAVCAWLQLGALQVCKSQSQAILVHIARLMQRLMQLDEAGLEAAVEEGDRLSIHRVHGTHAHVQICASSFSQ